MKAIITVIGKDKVGIIAGVSNELAKMGVNILDISQTILQQYFTMIMLVDLKESSLEFNGLKEALNERGKELQVSIRIQHEDIFNSMHRI
ncbi:ACT domain-containing protein [Clostridium rectalis]|uniref:ACT domain-containing protein n=1 Tax=Clostridium rectalis TaxID=2040295 RepID=UPI000F642BDB|nr:ACT domain-containing protein [Clostridium rectalis]